MISDHYENGWKIQYKSEVNSHGEVTETWSNRETISAHKRQLTAFERQQFEKDEVYKTAIVYMNITTIYSYDRLLDPDNQVWDIIAIDNPHELDKWLQVTVQRRDSERVLDG